MKKIKAARYYLSRYLGWQLLLGLLYAVVEFSVIYLISKITSNEYLYLTNNLLILFNIIVGIILLQITLNKVFFKPYKYITITPKFQSINFWFATKTYLKKLGCILMAVIIVLGTICILSKNLSSTVAVMGLVCCWILIILSLLLGPLFIINRTVKKNATIKEQKTQIYDRFHNTGAAHGILDILPCAAPFFYMSLKN